MHLLYIVIPVVIFAAVMIALITTALDDWNSDIDY